MKKIKKVFKQIAKKNNLSPKSVEKEISLAILSAMENKELSESAKQFWGELTKNNTQPTPEGVVEAIVKKCLDLASPHTQKNTDKL